MNEEIDVFKNSLVPKHVLLTQEEAAELLERYNISPKQLPKIKEADPAARQLGAKKGDILRVERKSETAGTSYYFRFVI